MKRLNKVLNIEDRRGDFVRLTGACSYEKMHLAYRDANLFLFASSCENLPNILLEAMSAGLPVAWKLNWL